MLRSAKTYISDRKNGLAKIIGAIGGLYLVRRYVTDRLEEVKDRIGQERVARDNLKRRFEQTQEDVSYTILTLIQTLSEQILGDMNVEDLTKELQSRSKARRATRQMISQSERPPSSLASSINVVQKHDVHSEAESIAFSLTSTSYLAAKPDQNESSSSSSNISASGLHSWVEASGSLSPAHSLTASSDSPPTDGDHPHPSDSVINSSGSAHNGENVSVAESAPSDSVLSLSMASDSSSARTTTELWNEVKILTLTRTLTTLYSTTLLSLLTTIQLTILARLRYVQSVIQLERDERMRERLEAEFSLSNILLGHGKGLEDLMAGDMTALFREDGVEEVKEMGSISEEIENKYLTMSWWILHVGWKDVGERVRRGVEEAFDGVSLKSKLAPIDLRRIISDVRRRVEYEVTFEGNERRINFLSSLLPPTPETIQHVLIQGGFTSQNPYPLHDTFEPEDLSATSSQLSQSQFLSSSPALGPSDLHPSDRHANLTHTQDTSFTTLVDETHSIISSSDFTYVLEICLDRATEVFFSDLEKSIFVCTEPQAAADEPVRKSLAGLLPGLAKWSQVALNGLPNPLVNSLLSAREVECLSAIIFSKFASR